MTDATTASLTMRWVPVTNPEGRTSMECVWLTPMQVDAFTKASADAMSGSAIPVAEHAA